MTSDLKDEVVDVHLLLLLHDVNDQTVYVVSLPLQRPGCILVHIQVRLCGQKPERLWDAIQTARRQLLVQTQHT